MVWAARANRHPNGGASFEMGDFVLARGFDIMEGRGNKNVFPDQALV